MRILRSLLILSLLFAAACSDDDPPKGEPDLCEDVTCDGTDVCDPATGECAPCEGPDCTVDLCADVECDRGVCDIETGECANASVCTIENQATECLDGFECYGQECVDEATYCQDLECNRGVCSLSERACVDSPTCSSDMECLEGNFCVEGSCTVNQCDVDMVDCPRGVCDGLTGECVNPETCSTQDDCLDGNYCNAGVCETVEVACDECTGNQNCDYDGAQTVTCSENEAGCSSSLDCTGDRVCRDRECTDAPACEADAFEPNNTDAEATDYFVADKTNGEIAATLCDADVDVYTFDTLDDNDFTGDLFVRAGVLAEDIGLGEVKIEILSPNGTSVGEVTSTNGVAQLTYAISAINQGVYTIMVSGEGLATPGVRYGLYADLLDGAVVQACANAPAIAASQTGTTISGAAIPLAPSCVSDAQTAEDIYLLDLPEARAVSMVLTPDENADLTLSLRTACEIDGSETECLNTGAVGVEETFAQVLLPGRYYVVVHAANAASGGSYTLTYESQVPICTPADNACDPADQNKALVCNQLGTALEEVNCSLGCDQATGTCVPNGDTCQEAFVVTESTVFTDIPLSDLTNTFSVTGTACTGFGQSLGPEAFYQIQSAAGDIVTVTMDATFDASLYVLTECGNISSCIEGSDGGNPETVSFVSDGSPVFIGADAYSASASGTFDLDIQIESPTCTPNEVGTCAAGQIPVCNSLGIQEFYDCSSLACDGDACATPNGDTCFEAIPVPTGGGTFSFVADDLTNTNSTNCSGSTAPGVDARLEIAGAVGEIVTVTMTPSGAGNAIVYALDSCSDSAACLAGSNRSTTGAETLQFALTSTDPVIVVADFSSSFTDSDFTVDISVQAPECTPDTFISCAAGVITSCDSLGLEETYTCNSGICNGAVCENPNGEVCPEAIVVEQSTTFTGVPVATINSLNRPGATSCTGFNTPGGDRIYEIRGQAGDVFRASMTPNGSDAAIYILESCGDGESCLDGDDSGNPEVVNYTFTTDGSIFLYADYFSSSPTGTYDLEILIGQPDCTVGAPDVCDGAGQAVVSCSDIGLSVTTPCTYGCQNAVCNFGPNDVCAGAVQLQNGGSVTGRIEDFSNQYQLTSGTCSSVTTGGRDATFVIQGNPGDRLRAELSAAFDSVMYFVEDCAAVGTSCVAGRDIPGSSGTLSGVFPSSGQLFVIVDVFGSTPNDDAGQFTLTTYVDPQVSCTPGEFVGCNNGAIESCDSTGSFIDRALCSSGQCNGAGDACEQPNGNVCYEAIPVPQGGGVFTQTVANLTNGFNASSTCAGTTASGPDAVYQVQGNVGEVVTVTMTPTGAGNALLYILDDCNDLATCGARSNATTTGAERLRFVLDSTEPFFVVADFASSVTNSDFSVEIEVEAPSCTPGAQLGCSAGTVQYCDGFGIIEEYTCSSGACNGSLCDQPNGDFCPEAIEAGTGGTFTGTITDFTNQVRLVSGSSTACVARSTFGRDAIYRVTGNPGDRIIAELNATFDAVLYAVTDCAQTGNTCLEDSDSGNPEDITFVIPAEGYAYIVADVFSSTNNTGTGTYTLTIDTQAFTGCVDGQILGCNAGDVDYCDAGFQIAQTCSSGSCSPTGCDSPTGDVCHEMINVSGSASFNMVASTLTNTNSTNCSGTGAFGPDARFRVTGQPGEVVTVDMVATTGNPVIYALEACANSATCIAGSNTSGLSERLQLVMPDAGFVTIVTDFVSSTTFSDFSVDIQIQAPSCAPNTLDSCDNTNGDILLCDSFGLPGVYSCSSGQCNQNLTCVDPNGENCAEPFIVTQSTTFSAVPVATSNDLSLNSTQCTGFSSNGPEHVYAVQGTSGDVLQVTMTASSDASLYVLETCGDGDSCESGSDGTTGTEEISYVFPADGIVYVYADFFSSTPSGTYDLEILLGTPDCTPGDAPFCDQSDLVTCSGLGFSQTSTCAFGCDMGACNPAPNDTCATAIDISSGTPYTGNIEDYSDQHQLAAGGQCSANSTAGRDAAFSVTGTPGDSVTITVDADFDAVLWAVETCSNFVASCLIDEDSNFSTGVESFTTTIPASGTMTVIVDVWGFDDDNAGEFTITAAVTPPAP